MKRYIIAKSSRDSRYNYSGPTLSSIGKETLGEYFTDFDEAKNIANELGKHNAVGFEVIELKPWVYHAESDCVYQSEFDEPSDEQNDVVVLSEYGIENTIVDLLDSLEKEKFEKNIILQYIELFEQTGNGRELNEFEKELYEYKIKKLKA